MNRVLSLVGRRPRRRLWSGRSAADVLRRAATDSSDPDGLGGLAPTPSASSSSGSSGLGLRRASPTRPRRTSTCARTARPCSQSPHGKAPAMSFHSKVEDIKKGDKQIGIGTADVSDARRHPRRAAERAQAARARAPRDRDPAARVALARDRQHVEGPAQAAPPPRGGLRRARERGLPREDGGRGQARRLCQDGQPARGAASSSRS